MITATLTLRFGSRPLRDAQAWLIVGHDPAVWLDEVTGWDVPHRAIRLLALPRSAVDHRPAGALAFVAHDARPTAPSLCCLPYGKVGDLVYLPVEATLAPEVSSAELADLLSTERTYVWHPVSGLVAFERDDCLRISDLITIGPAHRRAWDRAVPGVAVSRKLTSLAPEQMLTVEMILGDGRGDIGEDSSSIMDLPPSPNEAKSDIVSRAARQGKRLTASLIKFLTRGRPAGGSASNWLDRLDAWSSRQLAHINAGLEAARNKEIARLLQLLDNDPAKGLRYAIPLGGDAHRGRGTPGDRLAEHPIDFSLGRLGGGRAADYWELSWDYQRRLSERYRELANREVQLGRHRRAAYIYAELLADYNAAAGALVDGKHWREAAVLYRKRLHRPLDAARCLEQGGLWTEAVALYEELQEYEKAGDLLVRLDQRDLACEHYDRAVQQQRARGDRLSAARLLEEKLNLVDDAISELAAGWPDAPQAVQCLRELITALGRLGRHAETRLWLEGFRSNPLPARNRVELVHVLADSANAYPDRTIREEAADCTRVLVSRQLTAAPKSATRQLLAAISRLAPEDRLLGRDCLRYVGPRPPEPTATPKVAARGSQNARHVRTISLPGSDMHWSAATCGATTIFVAGTVDGQLQVIRSSWEQADRPGKIWSIRPRMTGMPLILAADPQRDDFLLVHLFGGQALDKAHEFQATDACPFATTAGSIRGMSALVCAAARTSHGLTWLLEVRGNDVVLVGIGPRGEQISTEAIPFRGIVPIVELEKQALTWSLHARDEKAYVGISNWMTIIDKSQRHTNIEFPEPIMALVGSPPKTRTRVAATFAVGGAVYWDELGGEGYTESFATELPEPRVCFTKGGHLVVVSAGRGEVYRTRDQHLQLATELHDIGPRPLAVLPGPHPNQFAIVSQSGEIDVYELP